MAKSSVWQSITEWSGNVPQRWWSMVSVPLTFVSLLAGVISYVVWARKVPPPLPLWNIGLIVGGALLFLAVSFLAFHRVRVERDKYKKEAEDKTNELTQLSRPKPDLSIGAKLDHIYTYGYYDKAFINGVQARDEGDKKIVLDVVMSPLKPLMLDDLSVEVWGQKYQAMDFDESGLSMPTFPMLYRETAYTKVYVSIPKQSAINTKEARILALANGIEHKSEPFSINFEDAK